LEAGRKEIKGDGRNEGPESYWKKPVCSAERRNDNQELLIQRKGAKKKSHHRFRSSVNWEKKGIGWKREFKKRKPFDQRCPNYKR